MIGFRPSPLKLSRKIFGGKKKNLDTITIDKHRK